ncbi:MAG: FliM/FliN family flagellar motor switch protein [Phycisphaerales bacterium]|nr:MAG: FliM/FliN family flagellar motor switch protein [Phycisphaerales bacterium]
MPGEVQSVLKLEVPLIVQIADRMMPAEDVLALGPGAIMELPKNAEEELEILINNKPIGLGTAVKVGEHFGVRVTYVGDLRKRVAALAGKDSPASGPTPEPADPEAEAPAEQPLADQ